MEPALELIGLAIGLFIATNIDDVLRIGRDSCKTQPFAL